MRNQWHTSTSEVRSSTNVSRANNSNGSDDCRNFFPTLWGLGLVVFTLLSSGGCGNKNVSAAAAPPPIVQIVEVMQRDVPVYHEYLATLDGYVNAQIAQAEAQLGKTQLDVQRDTPLAKEKAIAQSQLDNDIQANLAAKATVQADKAAVEQAELNLEFTNVRSLVDGVAGIASGQVGNLVGPQIILTTVSQLEPIKAYFTVSEQQYLAFVKRNPTEASREAREKQFELELILSDGSIYPRKGRFFAADRHVDIQTGAIRLAGLFPNPGNVLRPGQFGRVRFISYTRIGALLVPQKAITELQGSYQVAVVGNDNKVTLRTVKVGERTGAMWIVDEGIKPGERVVVEGVQKVRDSMLVKPTLVAAQGEGN